MYAKIIIIEISLITNHLTDYCEIIIFRWGSIFVVLVDNFQQRIYILHEI